MSDAFTLPLLEWVSIPAGNVTLTDGIGAFEVAPFYIAKYPVTNAQFNAFIAEGGYKDMTWWTGLAHPGGSPRASDWREDDTPKLQVCWYEAVAFANWLAMRTGYAVRLPTEWEWQWAAAGAANHAYGYGDTFDSAKANTKESGIERTNPVTQYAHVATPFGVVDMVGNVSEWCLNEGVIVENMQHEGTENRALRGSSWNTTAKNARVDWRTHRAARTRVFNIGFRVVYTP